MTRWASSTNATEAAKPAVALRLLVDLDFASGIVRAHDGVGELVHAGNTYLGVGRFGGIDQIPEDGKTTPQQVTFELSGIPNEDIGTAMTETYQGRAVTLWIGFLSESGAWVATPEVAWSGVMDVMEVNLGQNEAAIRLTCDDPDYAQPFVRRYTREDHRLDFASDRFFEYVPRIPGFRGMWGQKGYGWGMTGNGNGYLVGPPTFNGDPFNNLP